MLAGGHTRQIFCSTGSHWIFAPLLGGMIFDSPAWEATPAVSAALYFLFSVIARIIVALNHELHHIEQQRLKLMRSHATSEVDDDDDETESYPHHSWLQLIPGVKIHSRNFTSIRTSCSTAVPALSTRLRLLCSKIGSKTNSSHIFSEPLPTRSR